MRTQETSQNKKQTGKNGGEQGELLDIFFEIIFLSLVLSVWFISLYGAYLQVKPMFFGLKAKTFFKPLLLSYRMQ